MLRPQQPREGFAALGEGKRGQRTTIIPSEYLAVGWMDPHAPPPLKSWHFPSSDLGLASNDGSGLGMKTKKDRFGSLEIKHQACICFFFQDGCTEKMSLFVKKFIRGGPLQSHGMSRS